QVSRTDINIKFTVCPLLKCESEQVQLWIPFADAQALPKKKKKKFIFTWKRPPHCRRIKKATRSTKAEASTTRRRLFLVEKGRVRQQVNSERILSRHFDLRLGRALTSNRYADEPSKACFHNTQSPDLNRVAETWILLGEVYSTSNLMILYKIELAVYCKF
uniref:Uncharacterized protein n=1 Tax=Glossina palpalis gambiensis TaxID=67801 RepID=A0A1B0B2I2_9MUSC